MAITLSTIRDRLNLRVSDITDVSDDHFVAWGTDLNQMLYRAMINADPERFITSTTFTVSSSPSTQSLPAAFRDIASFGTGFFVRNPDGTDSENVLPITGFGSTERGYYITGTSVVFTGISSSITIVLRYIPTLDDLVDLNSTFCVPDENAELLEEGIVMRYYRFEEDDRENKSDERFSRLFDEFVRRLPKRTRVYRLPNLNSAY